MQRFKYLFFLVIITISSLSVPTFAGRDLSGGGTIFFATKNSNPILLDFASARPEIINRNFQKSKIQLTSLGYADGDALRWDDEELEDLFQPIKQRLNELFKTQPFLASNLLFALEGLGLRYSSKSIGEVSRYEVPEKLSKMYPQYEIKHIVRYIEEVGAFVDAELFDTLDYESQVGLIYHELFRVIQYRMYALESETVIHEMTSQLTFNDKANFQYENPELYVSEFRDMISTLRVTANPHYIKAMHESVCTGLNIIIEMTSNPYKLALERSLQEHKFVTGLLSGQKTLTEELSAVFKYDSVTISEAHKVICGQTSEIESTYFIYSSPLYTYSSKQLVRGAIMLESLKLLETYLRNSIVQHTFGEVSRGAPSVSVAEEKSYALISGTDPLLVLQSILNASAAITSGISMYRSFVTQNPMAIYMGGSKEASYKIIDMANTGEEASMTVGEFICGANALFKLVESRQMAIARETLSYEKFIIYKSQALKITSDNIKMISFVDRFATGNAHTNLNQGNMLDYAKMVVDEMSVIKSKLEALRTELH